jgi:predicted nucleic acid-binding protein
LLLFSCGVFFAVVAWLREVPDSEVHLSAVTIGELQAGIEITHEQDLSKAAEIETWLDQVTETYNVLPMDARIFRSWARLMRALANPPDSCPCYTAKCYVI